MNKFKPGDKVIVTWIKGHYPYFTLGQTYTIGGKYYDPFATDHFAVVADDEGENNGHQFRFVKVELAQPYLNEQKMKKLLGVLSPEGEKE